MFKINFSNSFVYWTVIIISILIFSFLFNNTKEIYLEKNQITNTFEKYSYQNGEKYVGEFKGNAKNGFGTYYYLNKDYYEGFWKDDKCHGKGKETYKDGSFFEG